MQVETIVVADAAGAAIAMVEIRTIEDDGDNVGVLLTGAQSLALAEALKLAAAELGASRPALSQVIE